MAKPKPDPKKSKSLTMGFSAFDTNVKFHIVDAKFVRVDESNSESPLYPAFITDLGETAPLSIASLLRKVAIKPREDEGGNLVNYAQPTGSFITALRAKLAEHRGKTNEAVLPVLVEAFKDKPLKVRLREYVTCEGEYGDYLKAVVHIDFADEPAEA